MTIPGSHRRFLDLERQATSAIFYSGEVIHGLLQTEGYAQALLHWNNLHEPEVVERVLKLRMGRSAALSRSNLRGELARCAAPPGSGSCRDERTTPPPARRPSSPRTRSTCATTGARTQEPPSLTTPSGA
ncbi:MAG: Scr1 family TA system antitoxin-like transcriptional regulator, partial [Pseudonocardiaceae bacterium]